jgi:tRNA threonylcarbamoyl adenosine modification protein (Sua5/YciO/YrdC/YwlC family)
VVAVTDDRLDRAASAIAAGRLVVVPTDTVYGLAARPDDPRATDAIFEAKGRDRSVPLPVLAPDLDAALGVAAIGDRGRALAEACWPGALTLVAPRTPRSATWDLGDEGATVGVRVPAHRLLGELLCRTGPLAVTSANRSGEPPATTCAELRAAFGSRVDEYVCEDEPLVGAASTVVDLAHGPPALLREGDLPAAEVARWLPAGEALLDSRPSP